MARHSITDSAESSLSVYRFRRTSECTRAISSCQSGGFARKSSAPVRMPCRRSSRPANPVNITTGISCVAAFALRRRQISNPSIPGMTTSSSTTSGWASSMRARARSPSSTTDTSNPRAASIRLTISPNSRESSITSTRPACVRSVMRVASGVFTSNCNPLAVRAARRSRAPGLSPALGHAQSARSRHTAHSAAAPREQH